MVQLRTDADESTAMFFSIYDIRHSKWPNLLCALVGIHLGDGEGTRKCRCVTSWQNIPHIVAPFWWHTLSIQVVCESISAHQNFFRPFFYRHLDLSQNSRRPHKLVGFPELYTQKTELPFIKFHSTNLGITPETTLNSLPTYTHFLPAIRLNYEVVYNAASISSSLLSTPNQDANSGRTTRCQITELNAVWCDSF